MRDAHLQLSHVRTVDASSLIDLFKDTFSDSEGPAEGALIGELVSQLLANTSKEDLHCFTAYDDNEPTGAILFTRLSFPEDVRTVWMLAPVAVATRAQRKGVGQALIRYGLDKMASQGAEVAVTYGDPKYYGRFGFSQVSADVVAPPLQLQFPEGWMAQSLTDTPLTPLKGSSACVAAFNDPAYW